MERVDVRNTSGAYKERKAAARADCGQRSTEEGRAAGRDVGSERGWNGMEYVRESPDGVSVL